MHFITESPKFDGKDIQLIVAVPLQLHPNISVLI